MIQRVFNLFIPDENVFMSSIECQTIDGVNEIIQAIRSAQKKNKGQEYFVTVVSSNSYERHETFHSAI